MNYISKSVVEAPKQVKTWNLFKLKLFRIFALNESFAIKATWRKLLLNTLNRCQNQGEIRIIHLILHGVQEKEWILRKTINERRGYMQDIFKIHWRQPHEQHKPKHRNNMCIIISVQKHRRLNTKHTERYFTSRVLWWRDLQTSKDTWACTFWKSF